MTTVPIARLHLGSEEDTARLAGRLAAHLSPGDVLLLEGPIGAGKTFFARALIQHRLSAAGRNEEVPSPTYTLVQTYHDGAAEIWHADLYRLGADGSWVELGLDEAFETAICLIEWPDRLGSDVPPGALRIIFEAGGTDTARILSFFSDGADWVRRLAEAGVAAEQATHAD